jgi:hypothetical protein
MNRKADWHYFFQPPDTSNSTEIANGSRPYGDLLLSPYPIDCEMSIGGTLISPSRSFQPIPPLVGHVSLLSPDSFHDPAPRVDARTHYLGEAIKIGLTFVSGYEFRVSKHSNNVSAPAYWHANSQLPLAAAAAEHLLCNSGITANAKNPPAEEKQAHIQALDHVTGLLRDERLPDNVRHAFLNAMDVLHIAISCAQDNPGLAVSLSVASIEAGAECFFGKDRSQLLNEKEAGEMKAADSLGKALKVNYKELLSKEESDFIGTLVGNTKTLYHEQRHYTMRKFLLFCDKFAPCDLWDELARHPYFEIPGGNNLTMPQSPFSAAPSQIDKADLRTLLEETYAFRNKYVHCALQPAALATPTPDTYFETFFDFDEECFGRAIKPVLIIGIARKALVAWLEQTIASCQVSAQPASLI